MPLSHTQENKEASIEIVAWNLGGNNPKTLLYYKGNTEQKLWSYNGSANPRYPGEVLSINRSAPIDRTLKTS